MLHGNVLLHGWVLSDVSFGRAMMRWTTRNGKHHTETLNWHFDKGIGW